MFTGIITDVGEVVAIHQTGSVARLVISTILSGFTLGASVAVSGVCLTVVAYEEARLSFDLGAETLALTRLGSLQIGQHVNLERALKMGDELGGHLVSGHVDGLAEILTREDFDTLAKFRLRAPPTLSRFIATKGSVALDGTSLTVNAVEGDVFEVLLIPHTLKVTTWGERQAGDPVHLEVDTLARYAARLSETSQ